MSTTQNEAGYGTVNGVDLDAVQQGIADPSQTVLSARKLIKTFGKVIGLDGVDLDLYPGEILAIIGDNSNPKIGYKTPAAIGTPTTL